MYISFYTLAVLKKIKKNKNAKIYCMGISVLERALGGTDGDII